LGQKEKGRFRSRNNRP